MFTFIRHYINKITTQSVVAPNQLQQLLKMYDLSKAEKILVVVSLDVGNLSKLHAEHHCESFRAKLYDNSLFSNKDLYSIFIIPVRGSLPTTMEFYSVPK